MALFTVVPVFLGTFLLAAIAVVITRFVMDRRESGEEEAEPAYQRRYYDDDESLVREEAELSSFSPIAKLLERLDLVKRVKIMLVQADSDWSVGRLVAAMLLSGALGMSMFSYFAWLPFWGLTGITLLVAAIPYFVLNRKRNKRMTQLEEQFPEAMESIARAMRAGYAFAGAFDNVAAQLANPLGKEFRQTYHESALGLPWEQALENLAARLPVQEIHLFVAAVQVQSKSGGDLSEVLEKFAENMREASALRGEVRSLSSQGRFAGYILTAMPIAISAAMFLVNPGFMQPLFQEEIGRTLLTCAAAGLVAAHFIIRKLVDIRL